MENNNNDNKRHVLFKIASLQIMQTKYYILSECKCLTLTRFSRN